MSISDFVAMLPKHKCSLDITHNQHKDLADLASGSITTEELIKKNDFFNSIDITTFKLLGFGTKALKK